MMEVLGKLADDVSERCDVCQSNSANGFCEHCKEYMCLGCFQDHKKAKPCRNHVLAPLDQAVGLMSQKIHEEKCKVHTTENIRYYCRQHEVVGCGDCIVYQHGGCKAEVKYVIKDFAIKFEDSADFKEMLSRIQKCSTDNKENTKRLENNIKQNKGMIDKALYEIRKFRKEINDYIDRAEKTIIDQANKLSKNNETMFSQLHQKTAEVSKEIDEIREKLDTNFHKGEDLFIRMVECKGRESHVQQTVAEIKSRNVLKAFVFQPDQQFKHMFSSNIRLGTIQINEIQYNPPDPRSAGFYVGKRVKSAPGAIISNCVGNGTGTIVYVDPKGFVEVSWDQGSTFLVAAGYNGVYSVQLL